MPATDSQSPGIPCRQSAIFFFNWIAVSPYGPLQRAAVRACYVPGCPVHLSLDCVILLGFERNKWRWRWKWFAGNLNLTLNSASISKKEENRSPFVINWHITVCTFLETHATCQPIIAHYRPATARMQHITNHVTVGRRYTTCILFSKCTAIVDQNQYYTFLSDINMLLVKSVDRIK